MYINNVIIRKIEFYITRNVVCCDCSYIVPVTASIEPHRLLGYIYREHRADNSAITI